MRWFHVGRSPAVAKALAAHLGGAPAGGSAAAIARGDVVVVEAFADLGAVAGVLGGNAFSACRAWRQCGASVYVVVRADDPTGVQLARFVLADAVLVLGEDGQMAGLEQFTPRDRQRTRATIDTLLARYGASMARAGESPMLQRMAEWESSDSLLQRLQDPETGLFDGAYAAMKIDEEWKRSQRFHLPLALVLLDIGKAAAALAEGPDRRALLAEVAAVLLNECRDIDVLARFLPTTFLLLLPGTPPAGAEALVRRLLAAFGERQFEVRLEPVAGVAVVPAPGVTDRREFVALADACLQRARHGQGVGGLVTAWE